MSIEVRDIAKRFGSFHALRDVSLSVETGELVALLGPSGSGKTTLLRVIAGLEAPDAGQVLHHGGDVTGAPVRDRNVGFVFQHFALFSHLDVFENVAFALRVRKRPEAEVRRRVEELIALVQLQGYERRMPAQLSGGQRQRVALARALAARPQVLLLDEPFSALDAQVRKELRAWLRRLHDEIRTTCLFVTHDQDEAFELADRVVLFHQGRIEQAGTAEDLYRSPNSLFVMRFLGHVNFLPGRVAAGRWRGEGLDLPADTGLPTGPAVAAIRTHEIDLQPDGAPESGVPAVVERCHPTGPRLTITLRTLASGLPLLVEVERDRPGGPDLTVGGRVLAVPRRVRLWPSVDPAPSLACEVPRRL